MTQIPQGEDQHPADTIEAIEARVEGFLADTEDTVARLAIEGATADEAAEIEDIKEKLQGIGEMVLRSVEVLDETEIPIKVEQPHVDEEMAYSLVQRFVQGRGFGTPFSTRELREHLQENGITIDAKRFGRWFTNWRTEIEQDAREAGNQVRFTRVPKEYGMEPGTYALAPQIMPTTVAAVRSAPPTDLHLAPEAAAEATDRVTREALAIITANPEARASQHVNRLAETLGISAEDARAAYGSIIESTKQDESGTLFKLYKERREGTLYFSLEPVTKKPRQTDGEAEKNENLAPSDEQIARAGLEALAQIDSDKWEQGLTAREIERYALLKDPSLGIIGSRRMNRIFRALERTAVIRSVQSRQRTGGSQFRIRASDRVKHNLLKNQENWAGIIEAARDGIPYELPS